MLLAQRVTPVAERVMLKLRIWGPQLTAKAGNSEDDARSSDDTSRSEGDTSISSGQFVAQRMTHLAKKLMM
jgi:hypothetical protein